jgi:5S rRNA maturation endonuclease (ribonuclease M5)
VTRDEALARQDLSQLLETIGRARGLAPRNGQYPCPCSLHEQSGDTPPAEVRHAGQGYDLWVCHVCRGGNCLQCGGGGTAIDALVVSGWEPDLATALKSLGIEDEAPAARVPDRPAKIVKEYVYTDENELPLFQVCRMDPKSFRQRRWEDGRWQWGGMKDVRLVPYRLPRVLAALARNEVVFIVEGEKDAEAIEALGKTATTMPGGAGKWRDEYTKLLAGTSHRFIVIGDDDEPGRKHALDVWRKLSGRVGQVVARLPAEGFKDVSDMIAAGVEFSSKNLRIVPELADPEPEPGEPPASASAGALMMTARAMASRPAPKRELRVVGPLLQRGMRTTIGAQTGEGKTTMALQAIRSLVFREPFLDESWVPSRPGRALVVDLEQGEETLKRRLREAHLDDTDAVDVLWQPAGLSLDSDPADQALLQETIANGGYDLIVIDPLYQMHRGNANDERVAADLMRVVDTWARDYNAALVIPMHARKPHPQAGKSMTIHDIAGSGSWNRNAEFVVGLQTMNTGVSRMWFFKDRIGDGPAIQSHWFLSFDREEGFKRSHLEDRQATRKRLQELLDRDEGATREELLAAGAGADENDVSITSLRRILRGLHLNGERYRSRPWEEQQSLLGETS